MSFQPLKRDITQILKLWLVTISSAGFYHFDLFNAIQFNTAKTGAQKL
jgi:hypothetical protein